jgi:hypothetical protein
VGWVTSGESASCCRLRNRDIEPARERDERGGILIVSDNDDLEGCGLLSCVSTMGSDVERSIGGAGETTRGVWEREVTEERRPLAGALGLIASPSSANDRMEGAGWHPLVGTGASTVAKGGSIDLPWISLGSTEPVDRAGDRCEIGVSKRGEPSTDCPGVGGGDEAMDSYCSERDVVPEDSAMVSVISPVVWMGSERRVSWPAFS